MDDVEALGVVLNLRDLLDGFLVSDDPSSTVWLEDCHRSTVCSLLQ